MRSFLVLIVLACALIGCSSSRPKYKEGMSSPGRVHPLTRSGQKIGYFMYQNVWGSDPHLRLDDRSIAVIGIEDTWDFVLRHFFVYDKEDPFYDAPVMGVPR
jgi:hypothetical protein